jgi:phytoene/squalene synthetase
MDRFGINENQLRRGICTEEFRQCVRFEVDRTEAMFDEGDALLPLLSDVVRPQISLFGQGGRAILKAIRRRNYDTLTQRPALSRWQMGRLIFSAMAARLTQVVGQEHRA